MTAFEELKDMLPSRPVFEISFTEENVSYLNSKIGGSFFWPDKCVPELKFLAQINLSELPANDIFPKDGLLQFFIKDDACYGLFDEGVNHLVVYHSDTNVGVEVLQDFPDSPVQRICGMKFVLTEESMSFSDFRFNSYALGFDEDEFDEELYELFPGTGSKLLGYPFFTQYDPRKDETYDVLLFQLDSEEGYVMWGDCGVGNFFIKEEALYNMDFTDVFFSWDCC